MQSKKKIDQENFEFGNYKYSFTILCINPVVAIESTNKTRTLNTEMKSWTLGSTVNLQSKIKHAFDGAAGLRR